MVEIITREFIQMASNAGEVIAVATLAILIIAKETKVVYNSWNFFLIPVYLDGAGEGQDSAQVNVDDEPRVAAGYF